MKFEALECALLSVMENVGHYEARECAEQYIVWAEDGQAGARWADGAMQEQTISGTVDYFTKTEEDVNVKQIQDAMNDAEISFRLNSIQYERDTKYIHYEWAWEMINNG